MRKTTFAEKGKVNPEKKDFSLQENLGFEYYRYSKPKIDGITYKTLEKAAKDALSEDNFTIVSSDRYDFLPFGYTRIASFNNASHIAVHSYPENEIVTPGKNFKFLYMHIGKGNTVCLDIKKITDYLDSKGTIKVSTQSTSHSDEDPKGIRRQDVSMLIYFKKPEFLMEKSNVDDIIENIASIARMNSEERNSDVICLRYLLTQSDYILYYYPKTNDLFEHLFSRFGPDHGKKTADYLGKTMKLQNFKYNLRPVDLDMSLSQRYCF